MIQLKKYLFVATFLLTLATTASAKLVQTKVYLFNDKGNFLYGRGNYSYQLRDFLQSQGFANATCITCFALSRKKAEKKYATLLKKSAAKGDANLRYIKGNEFKFEPIAPEK